MKSTRHVINATTEFLVNAAPTQERNFSPYPMVNLPANGYATRDKSGKLSSCVARFVLFFGILASDQSSYGQAANATMKLVNPPYIARTSNFMAVAFQLKADEAQKLLPANVRVKSDGKGFVSGGMEIYTTDQIYGVSKYTIAFVYVEVIGNGIPNGMPGNWPIWGAVDNDKALQSFTHFYNYPYRQQKITIERKGDEQVATVGGNGGEGFTLTLKIRPDKPVSGEGVATIYSQSSTGKTLLTEIPWLANGNQADVVSFEVAAGDNRALRAIQGVKPSYAQTSTNAFSYSRPIAQ